MIMIIEDDPVKGRMLEYIFNKQGYDILLVNNNQAKSTLESYNFKISLIISDTTEKTDSIELKKDLNSIAPAKNIPFIFLCSHNNSDIRKEVIKLNACFYQIKSFERFDIIDKVRTVFEIPDQNKVRAVNLVKQLKSLNIYQINNTETSFEN